MSTKNIQTWDSAYDKNETPLVSGVYRAQLYLQQSLAQNTEYYLLKMRQASGKVLEELRKDLQLSDNSASFKAKFGFNYTEIYTLLFQAGKIFTQAESSTYSIPEFLERELEHFFGILKPLPDTEAHADLDHALGLIQFVLWAHTKKLPPIMKKKLEEEKEEVSSSTAKQTEETATVLPPLGGGTSTQKKKEEEKEKKEKEKKPTEEEEKEKRQQAQQNLPDELRALLQSDRSFRQEVSRIQSALLHSMAARYGISEANFEAFSQALASQITPTILLSLNKLSSDELSSVLVSGSTSNNRINLYIKTLVSLQHNPVFQAQLQNVLKSNKFALGATLAQMQDADQKNGITPTNLANEAAQVYDSELEKEFQKALAQNPGLDKTAFLQSVQQELGQAAQGKTQTLESFEGLMRSLLRKQHIPESQIEQLFTRLQAYTLLRKGVGKITERDLAEMADLFLQSFGNTPDGKALAERLRKAFYESDSLLGLSLSKYMDILAKDIYEKTGNAAILFADPEYSHRPSGPAAVRAVEAHLGEEREGNTEYKGQKSFTYTRTNPSVLGYALFGKNKKLQEKEQQLLKESGSEAEKQLTYLDKAKKKRAEFQNNIVQFRGGSKNLQLYIMSQIFGFTIYDIRTYVHSSEELNAGGQTFWAYLNAYDPSEEDFAYFDAPSYIQDPSGAQKDGGFMGISSANEGFLSDRNVGKMAIAALVGVVATPAATAEFQQIIDKAEKLDEILRQIPIIGEIASDALWKNFELLGKILKTGALLLLLQILGSIAAAIGVIAAAIHFAQNAAGYLGSMVRALQDGFNWLKRATGEAATALTGAAQEAAGGVSVAHTSLVTLANSPITANAVAVGTASLITVVTLWNLSTFGPFLTYRPLFSSGGELNYDIREGFEGCWPVSGIIYSYLTYSIDTNGDGRINDPHAVMRGGYAGYVGPGTALDISGNSLQLVRTPFAGKATFFPDGTGIDEKYGNHVVLKTPEFLIIFGHLNDFADNQIGADVSVVAGQVIGRVGNTGNSEGFHLHYEVLSAPGENINMLSIIPLSNYEKELAIRDQTTLFNRVVDAENCSSTGGDDSLFAGQEGYMAIGPPTAGNVIASTVEEIERGPQSTCSWAAGKGSGGLAAAINGNFFNQDGVTPVGAAGYGEVKYFADPDPEYADLSPKLRSFLIRRNGTISILRASAGMTLSPYDVGVTGITPFSESRLTVRTAIGAGIASSDCSETYSGRQSIFLLTMPSATYTDVEDTLRACGAERIVHLDGGKSGAFCQKGSPLQQQEQSVPVNIGLVQADVTRLSTIQEKLNESSVGTPERE